LELSDIIPGATVYRYKAVIPLTDYRGQWGSQRKHAHESSLISMSSIYSLSSFLLSLLSFEKKMLIRINGRLRQDFSRHSKGRYPDPNYFLTSIVHPNWSSISFLSQIAIQILRRLKIILTVE
jgi:hypothetical protein